MYMYMYMYYVYVCIRMYYNVCSLAICHMYMYMYMYIYICTYMYMYMYMYVIRLLQDSSGFCPTALLCSALLVCRLQVVMEGHWPSKKRNWKILYIVVAACFYLLRILHKQNTNQDEGIGNPDFSILSRTSSLSSRKSLSALDVGLGEEVREAQPLGPLQAPSTGGQHHTPRHVYRLSTDMSSGTCSTGGATCTCTCTYIPYCDYFNTCT